MSASADDVCFLRWEVNATRQQLRLYAIYQGKLCALYLLSDHSQSEQQELKSFCKPTYDSIYRHYVHKDSCEEPEEGRRARVVDRWEELSLNWKPDPNHDASNTLLDLIRCQLPTLVGKQPLPGGKYIFTIVDDTQNPGQASIILRSDIYRQLLFDSLAPLRPETRHGITLVDLSQVQIHTTVHYLLHVLEVHVSRREDGTTERLIFKTAKTEDHEDLQHDEQARQRAKVTQKEFLQELEDWIKYSGHTNIMDPPVSLVTIEDGKGSQKLVGWLMKPHLDWTHRLRQLRKNGRHAATVAELLAYVIDYTRGMKYMAEAGYVHPDAKASNCFWMESVQSHERLVIGDFGRPLSVPGAYCNMTGPDCPEVQGHWEVSVDDHGKLVYQRNSPPRANKMFTILTKLADFPEAILRLQVFTFACVGAVLLRYRSPDPNLWPTGCYKPDLSAETKRWEELIPQELKVLLHRCWSFDPRDRPLFEEIERELVAIHESLKPPSPS
ncbi:hypothetical protein OC861_006099 [Tilletia horrida]|nr:hypothetical protein OC845_006025 [Tilletia horrida]KAK0560842.1 hypothetical protein OC861_006099 [Tilletia horrida]